MICDLVFKFGDKEILLTIESESPTYPTDSEILNALKNPINAKKRDELFSYIEEIYDKDKSPLDVEELFKDDKGQFCMPDGLIGNTTVCKLKVQNPDIPFPDGVDAKVLAVKRLKTNGKTISGRCINSNGEELFIVNTKEDLYKLAGFLKIRKVLQDNPNYIDENSEYYEDLEILRKLLKKNSISELILNFIEYSKDKYSEENIDKNYFRTTYFTNSKGAITFAYNFLDIIARHIQQYSQVVQYDDAFINAISKLHRDRENGNIKAIKYKELFAALKVFYPKLLKDLDALTMLKFMNRIKLLDFNKELFDVVIEGKPLIYTLLTNLIRKDRRYLYEVVYSSNDEVRLKWKFETLKSLFGFNYEAIHTFDLVDPNYRGYKIYSFQNNGEKVFIFSRNWLTEDTNLYRTFKSIEEVHSYLNENVPKLKLKTNSFLRFKFRKVVNGVQDSSKYVYQIENSSQVFTVKSIVDVLDIPINPNTTMLDSDYRLIHTGTLQDFYNLVNSWGIDETVKNYIINRITNAEEAVTYIYKINEILASDRTNVEELQRIADIIESKKASKISYYINSKNKNNYTLIPTEPNVVEKWREDKTVPVVQTLEAMKIALAKIGVEVNLLTASLIAKTFPNVNANTSRAFIFNGLIYVNTTIASGEDLLHEYAHIMLGILKVNLESRDYYELLVNAVWDKTNPDEQDRAMRDYSGRSTMDIREELFVRKFADYLFRNRTSNLDELFKLLEDIIKNGLKSIFDLLGDEPLSKTYIKSINEAFRRFSSDIATLLQQGSGLDLLLITDSRRKSTFINLLIKDKKIIQDCNG